MSNKKWGFYSPQEVELLYEEIAEVYQAAFSGEPWYEVSKCPDVRNKCEGGYSRLPIGENCSNCGLCPSEPAYTVDELQTRFLTIGSTYKTAWYIERNNEGQMALAALAWLATGEQIAAEKYADVPQMQEWVAKRYPRQIGWLDEVFANKSARATGNLGNFGLMVSGLSLDLWVPTLAYRTINPAMTRVLNRANMEGRAKIWRRQSDVPDRRDFIELYTNDMD